MVVQKDQAGNKTYTPTLFQKAKFNSWNYLAPIPQGAIDQNSKLEQNPGY